MVLLDGREVDGMEGNTVALMDRDTVRGAAGRERGTGTRRAELDKNTVLGAAGRGRRGGWDGWEQH